MKRLSIGASMADETAYRGRVRTIAEGDARAIALLSDMHALKLARQGSGTAVRTRVRGVVRLSARRPRAKGRIARQKGATRRLD
jgi:hypothetical protein